MIDPDERFNVFLPIFDTLFRKPFHRPDCRLDQKVRMRPRCLHFLLHSSCCVPPAVLPASVFSGKGFQVRRPTSMAALASTRGRTRVSIHSGSSVGCSVIAATKAVMNPSCTSMTPGPGACGLHIWSVIGGSVMATIVWYVLGGDTIGIGMASLDRGVLGKRSRHPSFTISAYGGLCEWFEDSDGRRTVFLDQIACFWLPSAVHLVYRTRCIFSYSHRLKSGHFYVLSRPDISCATDRPLCD